MIQENALIYELEKIKNKIPTSWNTIIARYENDDSASYYGSTRSRDGDVAKDFHPTQTDYKKLINVLLGKQSSLSTIQKSDLLTLRVLHPDQIYEITDLPLDVKYSLWVDGCCTKYAIFYSFNRQEINKYPKIFQSNSSTNTRYNPILELFAKGERLEGLKWLLENDEKRIKEWFQAIRDEYVKHRLTKTYIPVHPFSELTNLFFDDELLEIYNKYVDVKEWGTVPENALPITTDRYGGPAYTTEETIPTPLHDALTGLLNHWVSPTSYYNSLKYYNSRDMVPLIEAHKANKKLTDFLKICYCCQSGKVFTYMKKGWKYASYLGLYDCHFYKLWKKIYVDFTDIFDENTILNDLD